MRRRGTIREHRVVVATTPEHLDLAKALPPQSAPVRRQAARGLDHGQRLAARLVRFGKPPIPLFAADVLAIAAAHGGGAGRGGQRAQLAGAADDFAELEGAETEVDAAAGSEVHGETAQEL